MAKMGSEVVTILALMGEVILRPTMKQHWLHTSPKTAAGMKSNLSRSGTGSRGRKSELSQKSAAPPRTRKNTMLTLSMPLIMASLARGAIRPQMRQAEKMPTCAARALWEFGLQKGMTK